MPQSRVRLVHPPLKVVTPEGKEIDLDKELGDSDDQSRLLQGEPEWSGKNLQMSSATHTFYNRLKAQTICNSTIFLQPRNTTSFGCILLVEGILLNFLGGVGWSPSKRELR
jgi:hypothetical protein